MRHQVRARGFRYGLRPVALADAPFIIGLRTDPELGAFLHPTSPRIEDQEAWLEGYFARQGDYYFVVEDLASARPVGTVGIYNATPERAEWGRWLIARGAPAAVESAYLVYRTGLELLGFPELYSQTLASNRTVVSFHESSGAERVAALPGRFEFNGARHDGVEHRVDQARWNIMGPRLEMLSRRLAAH